MCDVYNWEEYFSRKMFTNWLLIGWPQQTRVEKYMEGKHIESPVKKNVPGAAINKDGRDDSLLEHKRTHHYQFPYKRYNCNLRFLWPTPYAKFTLIIDWYSYVCSRPTDFHALFSFEIFFVVWIVSTRLPTSKSSRPFNNPLVTVPNAPITIGTIVTFMFHSFF